MIKKLTTALALTLLASGCLYQTASAQNWRDIVHDVVTGNGYDRGYEYNRGYDNNRGYGYNRGYGDNNISDARSRADRIQRRLNMALDNGQISQRRFNILSSRLNNVRGELFHSRGFGMGGDVQARLNEIDADLHSGMASRADRGWY